MTWTIGLVDFGAKASVATDGRCIQTYMRKYLVRTDSAVFLSESDVASAVGITRGAPLDVDTNATCRSIDIGPGPVMTKAPFLAYFASYEFSTDAPLPEADDNDPTTRRQLWSISPQIQSRYVIKDRNGKLIVNKAKQPFDGGIPVDVRLGSATVKRNKLAAGYDINSVLANSGKLNSVTFLGGEPGTVQVDISAEEKYEGGYHFWAETYTFSYDPQGWQPKPVNAGFFQRAEVGSDRLVRITYGDLDDDSEDPDGKVPEPEPLTTDGVLLPIASRPDGTNFIDVDYYDTMNFEDLDIDTP